MLIATPRTRRSQHLFRTLRAELARISEIAAGIVITAVALVASGAALAQAAPDAGASAGMQATAQSTPAGLWRIIDDSTGKALGLMEITEHDGVFSGRLVKSLSPDDGPPKRCTKCTDARRDQPIIGMTLITGLRKTGDNAWSGGEILDPEAGKLYKTKLSLADNGSRLNVRGFIGISLLGRTQTWERVR